MATATTSPFTKDKIRTQMAYYFDDDRIAIIQKNGTNGEWDSISETLSNNADEKLDHRLRLHYHSRYTKVTGLEQDFLRIRKKNRKQCIIIQNLTIELRNILTENQLFVVFNFTI